MSEYQSPGGQSGVPAPGAAAALATTKAGGSGAGYNIGLKLLFIGTMIVGFLIPIFMLWGLNMDRSSRSQEAESEVARSWAGSLEIGTPYLVVPYRAQYLDDKNKPYIARQFLAIRPQSQDVSGRVDPSMRYKGIFPVPIFSAAVKSKLQFIKPGISVFGSSLYRVDWENAIVVYPVESFASLSAPVEGQWNGTPLRFDTVSPEMNVSGSVLAAPVDLSMWDKDAELNVDLALRGTSGVSLRPLAKSNKLSLESTWPDPSFFGSTLPETRNISDKGFDAQWSATSFANEHTVEVNKTNTSAADLKDFANASLNHDSWGVNLYQSLSIYQLMDRALKYSILFIVIPFVALFLFEMMLRLRVHLIQYMLVGLADLLFFLLLLSLSEQLGFQVSYLIAALAVVVLVSWYVGQILKSGPRSLIMSGLLVLLYGYMFAALLSEDYALLIGAIGLFAIVAAVMILTRKIDWYGLGQKAVKT